MQTTLNELRVNASIFTSSLLALSYNCKVNVDDINSISQIYKRDTKIALAFLLFYEQVKKYKNINPVENINELFAELPYFISFKTIIKDELDNYINDTAIIRLYEDYNHNILNALIDASKTNKETDKYLKAINMLNSFITKATSYYEEIDAFLTKYEPIEPIKEPILNKLSELKYIEDDVIKINLSGYIRYNKNNLIKCNEESYLADLLLIISSSRLLDENSILANQLISIYNSNTYRGKVLEKTKQRLNYEKREILYIQLEKLKNVILSENIAKHIQDSNYNECNMDNILYLISKIFKKYLYLVPSTEDEELKKIRAVELAEISNELKSQILKSFDKISQEKDRRVINEEKDTYTISNISIADGATIPVEQRSRKGTSRYYNTENEYWSSS
jgi:hypothetical protein